MIATDSVGWDKLLAYYPLTLADDKDMILRDLAFAASEIFSKWDLFYCDFYDDIQCGVADYEFEDMEGYYIEDVLAVTAGCNCLRRDDSNCGMFGNSYSVSPDRHKIHISPPIGEDIPKGLKVRAKLSIDLLDTCKLPRSIMQRFGVHIVNYAIYKKTIQSRDSKVNLSKYFSK